MTSRLRNNEKRSAECKIIDEDDVGETKFASESNETNDNDTNQELNEYGNSIINSLAGIS